MDRGARSALTCASGAMLALAWLARGIEPGLYLPLAVITGALALTGREERV